MHKTVQNLISIQSAIKSKLLSLNEKSRIPKIIAVSKTFKIDHILPLIDYGHVDYGENNEDLVGYFEQNIYSQNKECEIAYFGILEEYIGKKIGSYLLSEAIKKSFETGTKRIWVHTCSLDHKHALDNYLSRGMKVFKSESISF